eukprot:gene10284-2701_t
MDQEYQKTKRDEIVKSYSEVLPKIQELLNLFKFDNLNDIIEKKDIIPEEYSNDLIFILKKLTKIENEQLASNGIYKKNEEKKNVNLLELDILYDISREDLPYLLNSNNSVPIEFCVHLQHQQTCNIIWRKLKLEKCIDENILFSNVKYLYEFHLYITKLFPLKIDVISISKLSKKFTTSLSKFIFKNYQNDYKSCLVESLLIDVNEIFIKNHPDYLLKKLKKVQNKQHQIFIQKLKKMNHFKLIKEFHNESPKKLKIDPLVIPNSIVDYLQITNDFDEDLKEKKLDPIEIDMDLDFIDRRQLYFHLNFTNELWNEKIKNQIILEFQRINLFHYVINNGYYLSPKSISKIENIIPGYKYQKNKLKIFATFYKGKYYENWKEEEIQIFEELIFKQLKIYKHDFNQFKMIHLSTKELEILKPIYKNLLYSLNERNLFTSNLTLNQFRYCVTKNK